MEAIGSEPKQHLPEGPCTDDPCTVTVTGHRPKPQAPNPLVPLSQRIWNPVREVLCHEPTENLGKVAVDAAADAGSAAGIAKAAVALGASAVGASKVAVETAGGSIAVAAVLAGTYHDSGGAKGIVQSAVCSP